MGEPWDEGLAGVYLVQFSVFRWGGPSVSGAGPVSFLSGDSSEVLT